MNEYKASKKDKKRKDVAVLFSGGLDSTYLVWKNLKEGNRVTPYYTEILNNTSKSRIEKQQMAKIIGTLRQEFGDLLDYPRYASKAELYVNTWNSPLKFLQTPIWLMSTLYMDQSHDEIQIGYVANDDSVPYIEEIKESYKALSWLAKDEGRRPKLMFPIHQMAKTMMLNELPHNLLALIYSCEAPIIADEHELMNDDSVKFYRGSLIEFFEKDNNGNYVFLNHEPCGCCVPCEKILNYHYVSYVNSQPIYKKLRMKNVMREYDSLMHNLRYDEKDREMFNEITRVHGYRNTIESNEEKWKEVQLVPDHLMANEITGNDVMAKDEMIVQPIEKLEVEGKDGLARDHWTDVSFR